MTLSLRTTGAARRPSLPLGGLWQTARAVGAAISRAQRGIALRREIERMDDRTLADIGVSRAQMGFEVDRQH